MEGGAEAGEQWWWCKTHVVAVEVNWGGGGDWGQIRDRPVGLASQVKYELERTVMSQA